MDDEGALEIDDIPGGWSNAIRVARQSDEFTIEFRRLDPFEPRPLLVTCIIGSASLIVDLKAALEGLWQDYVRETMPPEVYGNDG